MLTYYRTSRSLHFPFWAVCSLSGAQPEIWSVGWNPPVHRMACRLFVFPLIPTCSGVPARRRVSGPRAPLARTTLGRSGPRRGSAPSLPAAAQFKVIPPGKFAAHAHAQPATAHSARANPQLALREDPDSRSSFPGRQAHWQCGLESTRGFPTRPGGPRVADAEKPSELGAQDAADSRGENFPTP